MNLTRADLAAVCVACFWASNAQADIVMEWSAMTNTSVIDLNQVVAEVGGFQFFAFQNTDSGQGTGISTTGSSTVAGPIDFVLGDLEQIGFVGGSSGGPATVQIYGEGDGNPNFINLFDGGTLLAQGEYLEQVVTTDFDTGIATAVGRIRLLSAGVDPAFFNEVMQLTGGTGIIRFEVDSFAATFLSPDPLEDPEAATGEFATTGRFIVTPEPGAVWLMLVAALMATGTVLRHRRIGKLAS